VLFSKFRNNGSLTIQDLFSESMIENSLNHLSWTDSEDIKGRHKQYCKLRNLNKVLAGVIKLLGDRFKSGKYNYDVSNTTIIRYDPSKVEKPKPKPQFTVSKPFKKILNFADKGLITDIK